MPSHLQIPAAKAEAKGAEEPQVSAAQRGEQSHLGHGLSKLLQCGALRFLKNDLDFDRP